LIKIKKIDNYTVRVFGKTFYRLIGEKEVWWRTRALKKETAIKIAEKLRQAGYKCEIVRNWYSSCGRVSIEVLAPDWLSSSSSSRHQVREGGMREMEELVLYGIKVEKAYRYVPWGEIEIVGRHVKTGRIESMSFSDPATRWQVEKELKRAGIEIELINLNSF